MINHGPPSPGMLLFSQTSAGIIMSFPSRKCSNLFKLFKSHLSEACPVSFNTVTCSPNPYIFTPFPLLPLFYFLILSTVLTTYLQLYSLLIILITYLFPHSSILNYKHHEVRNFGLFCSMLYP